MTGTAPKTWKAYQKAIMDQFLTDHAQDDIIAKWRGLHLKKGKSIKKYIDHFWDLHLKACVFEEIGFKLRSTSIVRGFQRTCGRT